MNPSLPGAFGRPSSGATHPARRAHRRATLPLVPLLGLLAGGFALAPGSASADTFVVDTTNDAPHASLDEPCVCVSTHEGLCTLRAAVQAATACANGSDHEIQLPAGHYTLTELGANEDLGVTGDLDYQGFGMLTVVGQGSETTVIDGNGQDRVFDASYLTLIDLTIENGAVPLAHGGGVFAGYLNLHRVVVQDCAAPGGGGGGLFPLGDVVIEDSQIVGNSAGYGGGIYMNTGSSLTVTRSVFYRNTATAYGGGIYFDGDSDGEVTISDSSIQSNYAATFAGGLFIRAAYSLSIVETTIEANEAQDCGGAVLLGTDSNLHRTRFVDNQAGNNGGALCPRNHVTQITESSFVGNRATRHGGAIFDDWHGTTSIENSSFLGNEAWVQGGAVYSLGSGSVVANHVTIAQNFAPWSAAVYIGQVPAGSTQQQFEAMNSIIADNTGSSQCTGAGYVSLGYNLSPDASCLGQPTDIQGLASLGTIGLHGGTTTSISLNGTSPAIDTAAVDSCLPNDQRGVARPQGSGCDRGAYEYVP